MSLCVCVTTPRQTYRPESWQEGHMEGYLGKVERSRSPRHFLWDSITLMDGAEREAAAREAAWEHNSRNTMLGVSKALKAFSFVLKTGIIY